MTIGESANGVAALFLRGVGVEMRRRDARRIELLYYPARMSGVFCETHRSQSNRAALPMSYRIANKKSVRSIGHEVPEA
ncbi:hypothetical protein JCM15831A_00160 [Asaia astilbis]